MRRRVSLHPSTEPTSYARRSRSNGLGGARGMLERPRPGWHTRADPGSEYEKKSESESESESESISESNSKSNHRPDAQ